MGADIDLTALGEAGRGLGIPTVCADLNDPLPFASKAFDVVVAGDVVVDDGTSVGCADTMDGHMSATQNATTPTASSRLAMLP